MNIFLANAYVKRNRAALEADALTNQTARDILADADRVQALTVATPNADLIRRRFIVNVQAWQLAQETEMPT